VMEHRQRLRFWEGESVFRLERDALVLVRASGDPIRLAYQDIVTIKARYALTQSFGPTRELIVESPHGRRIRIGSIAARLWALVPDDRSATFLPLARSLVAQATRANPSVRLTLGDDQLWSSAAAILGLMVSWAVLIIAQFFIEGRQVTWAIIRGSLILALFSYLAITSIHVLRLGRERQFTPDRLPEAFFGA